jgi:hypothetical protein
MGSLRQLSVHLSITLISPETYRHKEHLSSAIKSRTDNTNAVFRFLGCHQEIFLLTADILKWPDAAEI